MKTKSAEQIFEHWKAIRGRRDVPNRRDVVPAAIKAILPDLFILEHGGAANPRFRLAGTRLCALFGQELRGIGFERLWATDLYNRISRLAENVMAHRTPAVIEATAYGRSIEGTAIEIILMPLSSSSERADRIIGAACPVTRAGTETGPFRYMVLDRVDVIDPEREDTEPACSSSIAMPQSVMRFDGNIGAAMRRVLHLRVFEGGKQS